MRQVAAEVAGAMRVESRGRWPFAPGFGDDASLQPPKFFHARHLSASGVGMWPARPCGGGCGRGR